MNLDKLPGWRCRCPKHRAIALFFLTDCENGKYTARAYWNSHPVSPEFKGPKAFSEAIAWAKKHIPEEKACIMTEGERRRKCCGAHP